MVKLPAVGFIQEMYCMFMISFRDSLFRSYLKERPPVSHLWWYLSGTQTLRRQEAMSTRVGWVT